VNPRRLYRSRRDRQLAGVAGGIAEYLDVDPTVVRILWILSIFFGGFGILVYIVMAFIVPLEPVAGPPPGWTAAGPTGVATGEASTAGEGEPGSPPADTSAAWATPASGWQPPAEQRPGRAGLVVGVLLVAFGSIALAGVLLPGWAIGAALGPAFLVALGVALLVGALRRPAPDTASQS